MAKKYISTKLFDGFSTCFRQWRAEDTHCKFLHGYGVYFKVWFCGELDEKNWVFDFGGMKRAKNKIDGLSPLDWFKWLLDHTVLVADDDPKLLDFQKLNDEGLIQLRIVPNVGCERFAEYLIDTINTFLKLETNGRVKAIRLEFFEHEKNSAVVERGALYE
jgi:6-pyruvoyltetrahydropterin/6-carboxytetrahydropterin synthase